MHLGALAMFTLSFYTYLNVDLKQLVNHLWTML